MLVCQRAEKTHGETKKKPEGGEDGCDLSPKVKREMGIVPNSPMQIEVEDAACRKFHGGDDDGTDQGAEDQKAITELSVGEIDQAQAHTAAKCHRPVGESAEEDLNAIIADGTDEKEERIGEKFGSFFDSAAFLGFHIGWIHFLSQVFGSR